MMLRQILLVVGTALIVGCCALPTVDNPYPGSGGSLFHEPTKQDIADPRLIFDAEKLSHLRPGITTKRDVVTALGSPTWWSTSDNGTSRLGYDFLLKGSTVNIPNIAPATFVFDTKNTLSDLEYAGSSKDFRIERGPKNYAYVKALVGPESLFLGGIIPADWDSGDPKGTVVLGGFVRTPIHIERVLAGNISDRNRVVEFTVSSGRAGRWTAYMLLATDRFGTTSVVTWDTGPTLCKIKDNNDMVDGIRAVVSAMKTTPTCLHYVPE